MHACPVAIDTGKLVKELRVRASTVRASERAAREVAGAVRGGRARGPRRACGSAGAPRGSWSSCDPAARRPELPFTVREGAAAVYLPSCINRIFGNAPGAPARPSLPQALVGDLAAGRAAAVDPRRRRRPLLRDAVELEGLPVRGHELMAARDARGAAPLDRRRDGCRSWSTRRSCTHALDRPTSRPRASRSSTRSRGSTTGCSSGSRSRASSASVVVHPTCSARHLGLSGKLAAIAARIADDVVVPVAAGCCGMAGDRGCAAPGAARVGAPRRRPASSTGRSFDACVSSNRTCEVALAAGHRPAVRVVRDRARSADAGLISLPGGSGPPVGLCDSCRHQQLVPNTRGSVFSLCLRSRTEPDRFPRYPRLPVHECDGLRAY